MKKYVVGKSEIYVFSISFFSLDASTSANLIDLSIYSSSANFLKSGKNFYDFLSSLMYNTNKGLFDFLKSL